jgi:hypothetical protein
MCRREIREEVVGEKERQDTGFPGEIGSVDEGLSAVAQMLGIVHQGSNEINKMKRLLFLPPLRCLDRLYSVVQHWLSPPDPSTNQNFVSKLRHEGTTEWFFESSALTEWKAKGSLLWVHGKRTSFELPMSALH